MNAPRNHIVRVRFVKHGKVRFTSHRDVARMFERAIRRAGIPIAYSEGFSPRPRVSFGLALPTAYESDSEYVDLITRDEVDPEPIPAALSETLPDGLAATAAAALEPGADSLQQAVTSSTWSLVVDNVEAKAMQTWVETVLAAPDIEVEQERKGKLVTRDVRPAIAALTLADVDPERLAVHPNAVGIVAELNTRPHALRPNELLQVFAPGCRLLVGRRLAQWIASEGARHEPLVAGAAPTPTRSEICV